MIGASVWPIPIGNRWGDSGASDLPPPRIGFSLQQQCEVGTSVPRSYQTGDGWFTEGFDTRDLKEAKALLDELSS